MNGPGDLAVFPFSSSLRLFQPSFFPFRSGVWLQAGQKGHPGRIFDQVSRIAIVFFRIQQHAKIKPSSSEAPRSPYLFFFSSSSSPSLALTAAVPLIFASSFALLRHYVIRRAGLFCFSRRHTRKKRTFRCRMNKFLPRGANDFFFFSLSSSPSRLLFYHQRLVLVCSSLLPSLSPSTHCYLLHCRWLQVLAGRPVLAVSMF